MPVFSNSHLLATRNMADAQICKRLMEPSVSCTEPSCLPNRALLSQISCNKAKSFTIVARLLCFAKLPNKQASQRFCKWGVFCQQPSMSTSSSSLMCLLAVTHHVHVNASHAFCKPHTQWLVPGRRHNGWKWVFFFLKGLHRLWLGGGSVWWLIRKV